LAVASWDKSKRKVKQKTWFKARTSGKNRKEDLSSINIKKGGSPLGIQRVAMNDQKRRSTKSVTEYEPSRVLEGVAGGGGSGKETDVKKQPRTSDVLRQRQSDAGAGHKKGPQHRESNATEKTETHT